MKSPDKIYAQSLYEALESGKDMAPLIDNFLRVLKKRGALNRTEKILSEFEKLYNKKNNIVCLKLKSAFPLETQEIENIAKTLKLKNYELKTELDKNLIGGFQAEYEDNLVDATIKRGLNQLHQQLISY